MASSEDSFFNKIPQNLSNDHPLFAFTLFLLQIKQTQIKREKSKKVKKGVDNQGSERYTKQAVRETHRQLKLLQKKLLTNIFPLW